MVRQTSREAYNIILAGNILGDRQKTAYSILYDQGPLTGSQICQKAGIPGLWKRLSELEEMGAIESVGVHQCPVTGMAVTLWDVTPYMPRALPKKPSIKAEISCLKAEVEKWKEIAARWEKIVIDLEIKGIL